MAAPERKIPAPEANPETRPFWEAATAGRLLIGKCQSCGKPHYYPRAICPLCGSDATEFVPASGRGAVKAYIEREQPHLLRAYEADFLADAIETAKERCYQENKKAVHIQPAG